MVTLRLMLTALLAILPMALTGCATVLTPQRCEQAMAGANTAGQVIAVLVNNGAQIKEAEQIAGAIMIGKLALAAACGAAS